MISTQPSDTSHILKKLDLAFDDVALTAFCLVYFPAVYDRFGQGMRKDQKIVLLLDTCRRDPTGFERLLEGVGKEFEMSKGEGGHLKPLLEALEGYMASGLGLVMASQAGTAVSGMAHELTSQWLNAAGRKVRRLFGAGGLQKALEQAITLSVVAGWHYVERYGGGAGDDSERFGQWLRREEVTDEFILLLTPQDEEHLDVELLYQAFQGAGLRMGRASFEQVVQRMVAMFYRAATDEPLCETLDTEALRQLAHSMGALAQMEGLVKVSEALVDELVQIRRQSAEVVLGVGLTNERLSEIEHLLAKTLHETLTSQQQTYQAVETLLARAYDLSLRDARGLEGVPNGQTLQVVVGLLGEIRQRLTASELPDPAELAQMEAQYRERVIELFETLTFKGISHSGKPIVLPLEELYVELKAVADVPEAADTYSADERRLLIEGAQKGHDGGELARELDTLRVERWRKGARQGSQLLQRRSIHETLADPTQRGLVILGDPGSGKTTLLHYLALQAARGEQIAGKRRLPIFVPLAAYDDYMARNQSDMALFDFLPFYYQQWRSLPGLAPLFKHTLQAGEALLLFDGLDEVLTQATRQQVANQVYGLIQQYAPLGNSFVMTSRIVGYREITPPRGLPHVTVLDFGRAEIERFTEQWCLAFASWTKAGKRAELVRQAAAEATQELLSDIYSSASIERLAANPLLLTMLALMRHQTGKLPERRIRLYQRYMEVLLTTRQESRSSGARKKAISRFVESEVAEEHLIDLALWLQENKASGTASRDELRQAMLEICLRYEGYPKAGQAARKAQVKARQQADAFVKEVRYFAGILAERGRDAFGFLHLTFQEYYVGRALARMEPTARWTVIQPKIHNPRWHEPILLCAGWLGIVEKRRRWVDQLVYQLLNTNSPHENILHRDLFLATAIMNDDVGLSPALLEQLTQRLLPLQQSPIPTIRDRALAALAQLARLNHQNALNALQKALSEPTLELYAIRAVKPVIEHQACHSLRPLIRAKLDHFEERVREAAVQTLSRIVKEDAPSKEAIIAKLDDSSEYVRLAAVQVLSQLVKENAQIQALITAKLHDSEEYARRAAVEVLSQLVKEDAQIQAAITAKLHDPSEFVRQVAIEILSQLVKEDAQSKKAITLKLDDSDNYVRQAAVQTLSPLVKEDAQSKKAITAKLDDSSWEVRQAAVQVLSQAVKEDTQSQVAITAKLHDSDNDVRQAAVQALSELVKEDVQTQAAITAKLHDSSPNVRQAAVQALSELVKEDAQTQAAITAKLDDSSEYVRQVTVQVLSQLLKEDSSLTTLFVARINNFHNHDIWQAKVSLLQTLSEGVAHLCFFNLWQWVVQESAF